MIATLILTVTIVVSIAIVATIRTIIKLRTRVNTLSKELIDEQETTKKLAILFIENINKTFYQTGQRIDGTAYLDFATKYGIDIWAQDIVNNIYPANKYGKYVLEYYHTDVNSFKNVLNYIRNKVKGR